MSRFFRRGGDSDSDSSSSEEEEELLSQDESGDEKSSKPAQPAGAKPMSRFLRTGSDDSSSESEPEQDDDDSEDDEEREPEQQQRKSRFLKGADASDESSDEEVKTIVKSARDKRLDEMEASGATIEQKVKINDWAAVNTEFDKLTRLIQRQTNLGDPIPPVYIRVIISLDGSVSSSQKDGGKKKMDATKARALNTMKQKIKKALKEHEADVKAYTEDADAFAAKYDAATRPAAVSAPAKPKAAVKTGEDDEPADDGFTSVGKGGKQFIIGAESLFKTLQALNEARGKKSTDRTETVKILEQLHRVASAPSSSPYSQIRVLLALISARFDYNTSTATHMSTEVWTAVQSEINELMTILIENTNHAVVEDLHIEYDELIDRVPSAEEPVVKVRGSVISYIDRLDDEFTRSLQNIDPHGTEYVERLRDEKSLYETICRAQVYFAEGNPGALARVMMRRLEHIYSKPTAVVAIIEKSATDALASVLPSSFPSLSTLPDTTALVRALCVYLYQTSYSLLRTRAMLCHVYHHALSNDFHTARDLLLMSHLSETIHNADVGTQILFNRAVVQLGLCAFRNGLIKEAQSTLQDIFTTQRVKELLAQGVTHQTRYGASTLTPEQERAEKARQLPFHMHINTELLEAAFLVSSMLIEIPLLASIDSEEAKRKAISKPFRRLLDFADRQVFSGPPESTRDHIMQASKALQDGEWESCRDLIQGIKIWSLMPEANTVKEILAKRIQEEGLRTYLFTNAPYYASLSLSLLSTTFSLPLRTVTSIVSKMIWSEELAASLDQASGTVIFHRVELSRVQQLSQTLAERVAQLAESNTKALDVKLGVSSTGGWGAGAGAAAGAGAGAGGEKKEEGGVQTERRRGGERRGRGGARGRGARFAVGLGGARTVAA